MDHRRIKKDATRCGDAPLGSSSSAQETPSYAVVVQVDTVAEVGHRRSDSCSSKEVEAFQVKLKAIAAAAAVATVAAEVATVAAAVATDTAVAIVAAVVTSAITASTAATTAATTIDAYAVAVVAAKQTLTGRTAIGRTSGAMASFARLKG